MKTKLLHLLASAAWFAFNVIAVAQGTTVISYQGRLDDNGSPGNKNYDFQFALFDTATGANQIGQTLTLSDLAVANGLFTATLDFGAVAFNGAARWLEIGVRSAGGGGGFTTLTPRQQVYPIPYAIYSAKAATVDGAANLAFTGTVSFNPSSGPPFTVGSSTKVPSLNSDLLDGFDSTAFVLKAGDTMTGKLVINGPGGRAAFSDVGTLLGNDIAVAGGASSAFGIGVSAFSSGDAAYGVFATASGNNGIGVYTDASTGTNARAIYGRSTTGLAGYFDGAVRMNFSSPFNKPQLEIDEPSDSGFARLRMQTGMRPFWDIALGTQAFPDATNSLRFFNSGPGGGDVMTLSPEGHLHVRVLTIEGGADVAEPFEMSETNLSKGAVVVIDEAHPGRLKLSNRAYDTRVAGVISGAGGVNPGLSLNQRGVMEGDRPVALTGRVYVQADASYGPIQPGDLLTTSDTPGHAMKVADHGRAQGATLGKAMTGLKADKGLVLVLVTLQ